MNKQLVVVESPAKARTISRFVGHGTSVLASMGHIRDLPQRELGVDVTADFKPAYELTSNGKKVIRNLRAAAANVDEIYLATDPDREGEAIAWHLQTLLQSASKGKFHRIIFHEITKSAIDNSFARPGDVAENLVNAQQARRVLDRLVGYQISPLLWKNIRKGTSAGRVQSVALRLIVEREREINSFVPEEYWNLDAIFATPTPAVELKTRLARLNGAKVSIADGDTANSLAQALQSADVRHQVTKVTSTPRRQKAPPPFITSTLQQAAGSFLKFGTSQTMRVAQALYEGIDLGEAGSVGLITYMRTDSFSIAKEAQQQAAQYIKRVYGPEYLPDKPNFYRSRKSAQEAHEAIRPTDLNRTPESLAAYLSPQQQKLYRLIWNRFLASQMSVARQLDHAIEIESSQGALASLNLPSKADSPASTGTICTFRAAARETVFPGYLSVYSIKDLGEEDELDNQSGKLPPLTPGLPCSLLKLLTEQCFTSPPSRFSEASLVKALEQNGVGRPSTFAAIVNTILEREYVLKDKSALAPTELGFSVNDFLVERMPELFNVGFTAEMEDALDQIEEGKLDWTVMLGKFYEQMQGWLGSHQLPPPLAKPTLAKLNTLLTKLFPDDFAFDSPDGQPSRGYDDGKFIGSIRQRALEKRNLTERQWKALFKTLGKYATRDEKFFNLLEEAGLGEQIRLTIQANAERLAKEPQELDSQLAALLEAMSKITFEKATKRNRRIYDDGKFFRSLKRQAENGSALSVAQLNALGQMARKYASQLEDGEDFTELLNRLDQSPAGASKGENLEAEENGDGASAAAAAAPDAARQERCQALLAMTREITAWRPAVNRGKQVYNNQEFVESLRTQFEQKGSLSDRQLAALSKMLGKYAKQIDNYQERIEALGFVAAAPVTLAEKCPQCGAALVQRMGRGRPFVGCSAFPKCRYIAPAK